MNKLIGLEGLILSQPIADIVSIFIALTMFMFMNKDFKNVLS